MSDVINYTVDNGIAHVEFNRPDKKNALSMDLFAAIVETGETIKNDPSVRVVVVSGAGNSFCAGIDLGNLTDDNGFSKLEPRTHGIANIFQQAAWVWHEVPVPVIAAVEGVCFGGGLQIACGADMRYVHPDTKMSIMEIKWGLVPDMAGTVLWSRYVKEDLLRELSYTGEIFSGKTAAEYGFATRVTDTPLELAMATAKKIALGNPDAIRANKQLINNQLCISPEEGLLAESVIQDTIIGGPNQMEAVAATFEGRAPNFTDPQ